MNFSEDRWSNKHFRAGASNPFYRPSTGKEEDRQAASLGHSQYWNDLSVNSSLGKKLIGRFVQSYICLWMLFAIGSTDLRGFTWGELAFYIALVAVFVTFIIYIFRYWRQGPDPAIAEYQAKIKELEDSSHSAIYQSTIDSWKKYVDQLQSYKYRKPDEPYVRVIFRPEQKPPLSCLAISQYVLIFVLTLASIMILERIFLSRETGLTPDVKIAELLISLVIAFFINIKYISMLRRSGYTAYSKSRKFVLRSYLNAFLKVLVFFLSGLVICFLIMIM